MTKMTANKWTELRPFYDYKSRVEPSVEKGHSLAPFKWIKGRVRHVSQMASGVQMDTDELKMDTAQTVLKPICLIGLPPQLILL